MGNGRIKQQSRLAITVITITAAVMLVAATTEMAITGYAIAYDRNQAKSDVNECGNGQVPTNIGCQNIDSQIQGDENSVALTSQQTFPSVTREPPTTEPTPPPAPSITGTGTGTSNTFVCGGAGIEAGLTLALEFSAQDDGTVSGTYSMLVTRSDGSSFEFPGPITDGTTDGSTFTLTGVGDSLCGPIVLDGEITISGDCGEGVEMTYRDDSTVGTLTGDVECTLTF